MHHPCPYLHPDHISNQVHKNLAISYLACEGCPGNHLYNLIHLISIQVVVPWLSQAFISRLQVFTIHGVSIKGSPWIVTIQVAQLLDKQHLQLLLPNTKALVELAMTKS